MNCTKNDAYILPPEANILVMSGFSGVGKGTVCNLLKEQLVKGKPIEIIRSITNRMPRFVGENYTFVTKQQFADYVSKNLLLEYNDDYSSCGYGTPIWEVESALVAGKIPLLEIDYVGLQKLLTQGKVNPSSIKSVFIAASAEDITMRLCGRGTESDKEILKRLQRSIDEANHLDLYDAIIINHNIADTVEAVINVFEGNPSKNLFDAVRFKTDMEKVLATYSHDSMEMTF